MVGVTLGELAILPHAKTGSLRVLATSGSERSPLQPEVPTFKEAGFDFKAILSAGFFFPAGTPPELVSSLSEAIREVVRMPETKDALRNFGFEPALWTSKEFYTEMESGYRTWGDAVKTSGFVAEE